MMKKIGIFIILCIGLGLLSFVIIDAILDVSDRFHFKSQEDVVEVYEENKEKFVIAADKLNRFSFDWTLGRSSYSEKDRPDWKVDRMYFDWGIQLSIHDPEYFNEMTLLKNVIRNEKEIKDIIKRLKFKYILKHFHIDPKCVYFIRQTFIGFESGIIYCDEGEPENPYIIKLEKLSPSWYYYEAD